MTALQKILLQGIIFFGSPCIVKQEGCSVLSRDLAVVQSLARILLCSCSEFFLRYYQHIQGWTVDALLTLPGRGLHIAGVGVSE
jgi:hypothetical protein